MRKNMLLTAAAGLAALLVQAGHDGAAAQTRTTLDIYVVDVEGGNATLFVAPSGESLLIDTGNVAPAAAVRDAGRIMAAARNAGLTQIDNLIITHWHGDHYRRFGGTRQAHPDPAFHRPRPECPAGARPPMNFWQKVYPQLHANAKHTVAKPGDKIAVAGLDVQVVTSAGETIKTAVPGAGAPNPYCADFKPAESNAEDPMSVGIYVTFGKFRTIHLGDVTKNKEFELMCPANRIGAIDLFLGLHHGQNSSNSEVMIHATHPRVAIMNNGTRKGGEPDVDAGAAFLARPRRLVADALLPAQRPGIHRAGNVHRQPARRAVRRDAGGGDRRAAARAQRAAAAGPQRPGPLDQGDGAKGRDFHRHQYAKRLCQDLRAECRDELTPFGFVSSQSRI